MKTVADLTDFDGCRRVCRKIGHTLVWGECEHAPEPPEPEPTVFIARKQTASDGGPMLWFEPVPVKDLDEVRALRAELDRVRRDVATACDQIEGAYASEFRKNATVGLGLIRAAIDPTKET